MKITAENGASVLIQEDYSYPGTAEMFGWRLTEVQNDENDRAGTPCSHDSTDGTIDCPDCGITASEFIEAARHWLDSHDGLEAEADAALFD
jgi:hypothetical protein